jgi:hypothetical protein
MSNPADAPTDLEIAAHRARQARAHNPLEPGPGTPWEDRGSTGMVAAFFKTVAMAFTRPGVLLESMRRPETAGDARAFAIGCGIFWGLSWLIHGVLAYHREHQKTGVGWRDFGAFDAEVLAGHLVLGVVATWGLLFLVTRLAYTLISAGEMKVKFPPVLLYNVYAYALAPSVLAVIPYVGPALALAWIFALLVYGARSRLMIKTGGAIVCNIFAVGGVLGLAAAAYFSLSYLYGWLYSDAPPPDAAIQKPQTIR